MTPIHRQLQSVFVREPVSVHSLKIDAELGILQAVWLVADNFRPRLVSNCPCLPEFECNGNDSTPEPNTLWARTALKTTRSALTPLATHPPTPPHTHSRTHPDRSTRQTPYHLEKDNSHQIKETHF